MEEILVSFRQVSKGDKGFLLGTFGTEDFKRFACEFTENQQIALFNVKTKDQLSELLNFAGLWKY